MKSGHPAVRIRLSTPVLPLLAAVSLGLDVFTSNKVWLVLLLGLGGVWLVSWAWARSLARNLSFMREVRLGWAHVGDVVEERFTLINDGWAPGIWVEVLDRSTMPSYNPSRVSGVDRFSETRWQTRGLCVRRGLYMLGPTTVICQDLFGVYRVEKEYPAFSTMAVVPPVLPLPMIEIAPGGKAGDGRARADAPERTVDASGVRDYVPGDSLRWIHWRTSARTGSLHVRLFDGTPVGDWWIFVDMDAAVQAGTGESSTEEHAVVLAASLANRGIAEGRSVGLVSEGDQGLIWLPPREGMGQMWEILRALAMIKPGGRTLEDLLSRLNPRDSARSSVILITPNVEGNWLAPLLEMAGRGIRPTVLILDPVSYGGKKGAGGITAQLTESEIAGYVFTREALDRPELRPGAVPQFKWKTTPRGRAIMTDAPDLSWKALR